MTHQSQPEVALTRGKDSDSVSIRIFSLVQLEAAPAVPYRNCSTRTPNRREELQWLWSLEQLPDPAVRLCTLQQLSASWWSREQGWAGSTGTHGLDFGSQLHHNGIREAFHSCYILISAFKW